MIEPSPLQRSHKVTLTNWPKIDCWTRRISPLPSQRGQRVGWVPGSMPLPEHREHVTCLLSVISLLVPKTASSSVNVRS
jgi:hypothetical protein